LVKDGINCEIVDPRTLKPLDKERILDSVKKTGKIVVVSEGARTGGFASEVAAVVQEDAYDDLDAPVLRVTTEDVPLAYAAELELEAIPKEEDIIQAVKSII
jgi:pyruvate dehydrogenase E1 component beta subunit